MWLGVFFLAAETGILNSIESALASQSGPDVWPPKYDL